MSSSRSNRCSSPTSPNDAPMSSFDHSAPRPDRPRSIWSAGARSSVHPRREGGRRRAIGSWAIYRRVQVASGSNHSHHSHKSESRDYEQSGGREPLAYRYHIVGIGEELASRSWSRSCKNRRPAVNPVPMVRFLGSVVMADKRIPGICRGLPLPLFVRWCAYCVTTILKSAWRLAVGRALAMWRLRAPARPVRAIWYTRFRRRSV
jgi:hypothetical protein